jgi:diadenosine tetraphosphatase ApaH/serine/threonine PP2A family protein phosphatase
MSTMVAPAASEQKRSAAHAAGVDLSVVIAGLGLRLAPVPHASGERTVHPKCLSPDEGRVFVTELIAGGAAERSNLLKQNDEILHIDHVPVLGRAVNDVKNAILGTPGTSVLIGIRRSGEEFQLSFVRGHTGAKTDTGPTSADLKGTPTAANGSATAPRPTPKALFGTPGVRAKAGDGTPSPQATPKQRLTIKDAARKGDLQEVARMAADLMKLAQQGKVNEVQQVLSDSADISDSFNFSPNTIAVAHSGQISGGSSGIDTMQIPTLQYDGLSPLPSPKTERAIDRARELLQLIEPLMEHTANGTHPPAVDREQLRDLVLDVADAAASIQVKEPRLLEVPAPCYVLGDIHGNLLDLTFFKRTIWPVGPAAQGGDFLFLGDFVDRGADSLPVAAYMMAQKVLNPKKWWMIRGNHETREVNGNIKTYREGSFLHQCLRIFGDLDGRNVWERVNCFFDTLPLAARVANKVFCVHGGIPRELCQPGARLEMINEIASPLTMVRRGEMVHSMLWSDPVPPEREAPELQSQLDSQGFGLSSRGCACFGERTLDIFLEQHKVAFVFRGHEAQQNGIGLSRSGRLCTVFSTSKDHFAGDVKTTCGCVLVTRDSILPIVRGEGKRPISFRSPSPIQHHQPMRAAANGAPLRSIDMNVARPNNAKGKASDETEQHYKDTDKQLFAC